MIKIYKKSFIKDVLSYIAVFLSGCGGIVFSVLYLETFTVGFFSEHYNILLILSESVITVFTMLALCFYKANNNFVYKLCYLTTTIIDITLLSFYFLKISGLLVKIKSVEDLRQYISSFENFAVFIFVFLQFAQVVFLPIPAFITVGTGVLLFGPFKAAIYSSIGIILGSITAFVIGRVFGFKVAKWLVGEKNLNKCLKIIKGKDKILFTFMFLFPFFPDDILCFVAGITSISTNFFVFMIIIVRLISVFVSCYSINNSIIPYNTWWGIILWIVFFVFTIFLSVLIYKKGEKLEKIFNRRKSVKIK